MNLEELEQHIGLAIQEQNNRPLVEFEGYSSVDMHHVLYDTFGSESPIKLQKLSDSDYQNIPLMNQVKYLMNLIGSVGEIKLTKLGFLPTKVVSDLYHQGFLKEFAIEKGITKLYKETDSITVNLTRILVELAGLVKKRSGKLSLTRKGEKTLSDYDQLLKTIIETFSTKFNWAYYDGYGENHIGQLGFGFSLILLSKYGEEKRLDTFYAEKYFNAYPHLLQGIVPTYGDLENYVSKCYSIRTFDRYLDYFGLVEIEKEGTYYDSNKFISKTELFDRLIKVRPPNNS